MGIEGIHFRLNERAVDTDFPGGTILLNFIREEYRLTGTRAGCREGDCGACTVLLGKIEDGNLRYRAVASCLFPLADAAGCHVVTIEGLNGDDLNPLQRAFVTEGASQCGFCTPGLLVSLTAFLLEDRELSTEGALTAIEGNICRCTGYISIRRAVSRILEDLRPVLLGHTDRRQLLVELEVLPKYFAESDHHLMPLPRERRMHEDSSPAPLIAGGTDLYVQKAVELQEGELNLLTRRRELAGIRQENGSLIIGAATTVSELMESSLIRKLLPGLSKALKLVSSNQIRNRASLGGNIVNASPIGDLSVMMLALDARLNLSLGRDSRELKLCEFFMAYKKMNLRKGEIICSIEIAPQLQGCLFHYEKGSRRRHQDIASVCSAISMEMVENRISWAHVSAGGVAPIPLYLKEAAAVLQGRIPDREVLSEFLSMADREISPITDMRGSASYKRVLMRRLLTAHFVSLFPELNLSGDDL